MKTLVITENDAGQRIDRFLCKALAHLPPSLVSRLLRQKHFRVNGKHPAPDYRLCTGDTVTMYLSDSRLTPPAEAEVWRRTSGPVDIVYEDDRVLIADKPAGLLCHADEDGAPDTLINRIKHLLFIRGEWNPEAEASFTPALANRIDRNTAGLVLAAKTAPALRDLNALIQARGIRKLYLARCLGEADFTQKTVTLYLQKDEAENRMLAFPTPGPGRLTAVTAFRVLEKRKGCTLMECELFTGRTHQIRVTLAYLGLPLAGDTKYGRDRGCGSGQALLARKLIFPPLEGALAGLSGKTVVSGQHLPGE